MKGFSDKQILRLVAVTHDDREETTVNIGTLKLDHTFNDIFNLRNTLRYSYVDRESAVTNPIIP